MDLASVRDWSSLLSIAAVVVAWGATLVVALLAQRFVLRSEHAKAIDARVAIETALDARLDIVERRLIQLESQVPHLPSAQELNRLALAMKGLEGQLNVMGERIASVTDRLETTQATLTRHEGIFADAARRT